MTKKGEAMEDFSICMPESMIRRIDELCSSFSYSSRGEFIRDASKRLITSLTEPKEKKKP